MELRQIRYFQCVARELSFTRAARILHIAQPPLSRQIKMLEEELGVAVFERLGRGIVLTDAGRYFLDQTEKMTQRLEETINATRRIGKSDRIWFGVGFVPSTLYGHMPALIRQLRQLNTQVEIGLVEMTTLQQFEALKSGRIDIGVGRILLNDEEIERLILTDEPLVAALPSTHRLAAKKSVRLTDIIDEPLILYPARPRPSYADHVLNLFNQNGYSPQVIQEVNELQTAIGLVTAAIGIAIVPESVRRLHRDDVVYVELDEPTFTSPILLSWRKNDHSAFLEQVIGLFKRTTI
ncbi:LysR family transcriptional regulator [Advenella mimigardefordensis]|uniref:HTH-type transcriptional regulator CatR, LysR family n=1 Tax=Advenella mimigardefordensis (strain DSM 17166 / LMG 22922 / DPN7) TaxID=1247726 RepID=W0PI80_ADVMD|nr:LysR family transcriptional regulator [Advenella mimigardefordensis]AHG65155.1 HTH-type transcriptional regulator CatR, LysR family [Advenella mimigardefordensis DPN7]